MVICMGGTRTEENVSRLLDHYRAPSTSTECEEGAAAGKRGRSFILRSVTVPEDVFLRAVRKTRGESRGLPASTWGAR